MARYEVERVHAVTAANACALVIAAVMAVFVLLWAVAAAVAWLFGRAPAVFWATAADGLLLALFPIAYGLIGWVAVFVGAKVYNAVAAWTSGITIELIPASERAREAAPPATPAVPATSSAPPACPHCGAEYQPDDYREDVPDRRCSVCKGELPPPG